MQGSTAAPVQSDLQNNKTNPTRLAKSANKAANTGKSEMDEKALFNRVQIRLKAIVGPDVFSSWFGRLKLDSVSKSIVRLSVPTTFLRSWINNRYLDLLTKLFQEENPDILRVEIVVRSATRGNRLIQSSEITDMSAAAVQPAQQPCRQPQSHGAAKLARSQTVQPGDGKSVTGSPLDSRYSFATFVEGASNRVALAAARTIAEAGASAVRFNPLFIHSSVGLGKTHLLQAIALEASASDRNPRVVYLTAEYFMWRFATAIRDNDALSFKESLRNIDLLVIDDMQFLQGKSIQHEFCHLLNMLLDSARQVVVAADRAPWELESLDARVRSRLQGGVAIEIDTPYVLESLDSTAHDAAVVFSRPRVTDQVMDLLWMEELTLLCRPDMAARLREEGIAAALSRETVIHIRNEAGRHTAWAELLRAAGIAATLPQGIVFDTAHMALDFAAREGGLVVADRRLAARDIAEGRLAAPFDISAASGFGYFMLFRPDDLQREAVQIFRRRMLTEFAPSLEPARVTAGLGVA